MKTVNIKMATSSQLSAIESNNKLSKQPEQEQKYSIFLIAKCHKIHLHLF